MSPWHLTFADITAKTGEMRITQITENIYQLSRFGIFNSYLVRESDGYTLVDTMLKGSGNAILQSIKKLRVVVKTIVITHAHSDHVGSLGHLATALPTATRYISRRDGRFLAGDSSLDPVEPQHAIKGNFQSVPVSMNYVEEGHFIKSLKVIDTPGHTPGHVCYLDVREGSLLAGDAYSAIGGVATSTTPYWLFPPPGQNTWDRSIAQHSAEKLLSFNPTCLLTGHGKPVYNPLVKMKEAVRKTNRWS